MTVPEWVINHFQLIGLACIDVNVIFFLHKQNLSINTNCEGGGDDLFHATCLQLMSNVFVEASCAECVFLWLCHQKKPPCALQQRGTAMRGCRWQVRLYRQGSHLLSCFLTGCHQ